MMVKVIRTYLTVFGFAALMLAGPQAKAEVHCKEFSNAVVDALFNPAIDRHSAILKLRGFSRAAFSEFAAEKKNKLWGIIKKDLVTADEMMQFRVDLGNNCINGGPDSLLRDAEEKAIYQAQARHKN